MLAGDSSLARHLSALKISGDFSIQTSFCGKGVRPSTHCDVLVAFTPKTAGIRNGTLSFTDNASSSPQRVSLSGVGTTVSVSPTSIAFGSQKVGTTSIAQTVTVTNKGQSIL